MNISSNDGYVQASRDNSIDADWFPIGTCCGYFQLRNRWQGQQYLGVQNGYVGARVLSQHDVTIYQPTEWYLVPVNGDIPPRGGR